jgi:flavin reductase (DIM6/NTAB) family NADH-FMN oxidoreductase RutF
VTELNDELLNHVTWKIANPLVLIGSRSDEEWNAMTASWVTQVSMEPVLIGVGIDKKSVTHRLIDVGRVFTINLWPADDTRIFVKFSKPATKEGETLNGRPITTATTGAPVFVEALAWMDCEVRHATDFGTHTFYVGEVVDAAMLKPDAKPAAVADTRMKYGGVKRGGH